MMLVIIAAGLAAAFAALGSAKLAKAPSMVARAEHVGFTAREYQYIGAAELAGAAGVAAGLWFTPLGLAAGVGLVVLLLGALVTHVRQGDGPVEIAPAVLFVLAALAYVVVLGTA